MPIEYTVSLDGLRIEAFPKDLLDIHQTVEYFDSLQNDNQIKPGAIEIVYFTHVTDFKISYIEAEKITKRYQGPKSKQMIDATIFVCKTDLAYGIGRMLKTFHEIMNPKHKVVVVRSVTEINNAINAA